MTGQPIDPADIRSIEDPDPSPLGKNPPEPVMELLEEAWAIISEAPGFAAQAQAARWRDRYEAVLEDFIRAANKRTVISAGQRAGDDPDVHVDWHMTPAEWAEMREALLLGLPDSPYLRRLAAEGKLGEPSLWTQAVLGGAELRESLPDSEPPLPEGFYGQVEFPGRRGDIGWITEGTRAGQAVLVVRDWDGRPLGEYILGPACRLVHLPTPLKRPDPGPGRPALPAPYPWRGDDDDEDDDYEDDDYDDDRVDRDPV